MEELVNRMVEKLGIDQATAEKVKGFLQEHAAKVTTWLSSEPQQLSQLLQQKVGVSSGIADRIVAFLKEHMGDVQQWLSGQGGGILQKAKDALGGLLGGKQDK